MKTITIQIQIPSPPETHYFIPPKKEGITIRQGDLLCEGVGDGWDEAGIIVIGEKIEHNCFLARLRPYNPQRLSDEVLAKLPDKARFLSKEEYDKFRRLGGLKEYDKNLLTYHGVNEWDDNYQGDSDILTYATYHPENYYLTLDESAFVKGKWKLPEGFVLVTDPTYICKNGDMLWNASGRLWEVAKGMVGITAWSCYPYIATPIKKEKKLVPWKKETIGIGIKFVRGKNVKNSAIYLISGWRDAGVTINGYNYTYEEVFNEFEWSENVVDWHTCGIEEEESN